jgi:hypothetical protein
VIDLDDVATLCPGLRVETGEPLAFRAIIALQRRHNDGVSLVGIVRGDAIRETLRWQKRPAALALFEDFNRVTEEGAEILALALAGQRCGWTVKRRLQSSRREGADWLMTSGTDAIILEVGGTDNDDLNARHGRKITQAQKASWPKRTVRAACVVSFVEPRVLFWSSDGPR